MEEEIISLAEGAMYMLAKEPLLPAFRAEHARVLALLGRIGETEIEKLQEICTMSPSVLCRALNDLAEAGIVELFRGKAKIPDIEQALNFLIDLAEGAPAAGGCEKKAEEAEKETEKEACFA